MKNNSLKLLMLPLLIFISLFITDVYAKNESSVDYTTDFEGQIQFHGQGVLGAPELHHNLDGTIVGPYRVYDISFEGGGRTGTAFCVFPHLGAKGTETVRCGKVSPQNFPRVYYLVYNYWNKIKGDKKLRDFTMRMAGIMDKDAGLSERRHKFCEGKDLSQYPECQEPTKENGNKAYCDYAEHSVEPRCKRWAWTGLKPDQSMLESAFVVSWQHDVEGYPLADGYKPYEFQGTTAKAGYEILQDVQANKDFVKANWFVETDDDITGSSDVGHGIIKGKYITATRLSAEYETPKEAVYLLTSTSGQDIGPIRITPTAGSYTEVEPWDGKRGVIKVKASTKCKATIKVELGEPIVKHDSCKEKGGHYESYDTQCDVKVNCKYKQVRVCSGKDCWMANQPYDCDTEKQPCKKWRCMKNGVAIKETNNTDVSISNDGFATETDSLDLDNGYAEETDTEISTTLNPQELDPNIEILYCSIEGALRQSYIVVVDGEANRDILDLPIDCDNCYVGDCKPAPHAEDVKDFQLHNCCEDGVKSYAAQAALSQLFCTEVLMSGELIPGYKPQCNVKEYLDLDFQSNMYCKQYCGSTITYEIPGPTHAKSDAYFFFNKDRLGTTGPKFDQFKRCRTVINYAQFNSDYKENVKQITDAYTEYQKASAYLSMWETLVQKADSGNAEGKTTLSDVNVSCSYTKSWKYESCDNVTDWDSPKEYTCGYPGNGQVKKCKYSDNNPAHYNTKQECGWADGHEDYNDWSGKVDGPTVKVYDESTENNKKLYSSYTVSSDGYWNAALISNANKLGKTKRYYNKDQIDKFNEDIDAMESDLKAKANAHRSSNTSCSGSKCKDVSKTEVKCTTDRNSYETIVPSSQISTLKSIRDKAGDAYNGDVSRLKGIQKLMNECGGMYTGYDKVDENSLYTEKGVMNRIVFYSEPELEFSYSQTFFSDTGKLQTQEMFVNFYNVDENGNKKTGDKKCVYETRGSLKGEKDWDFWQKTGWEDDNYSTADSKHGGNYKTIAFGDYKTGISYSNGGFTGYQTNANGLRLSYWANRKYTTDAVGHMSCRWEDSPENTTYTLVPSGLVIEIDDPIVGKLSDLGGQYTYRTGTYQIFKTTQKGKYEVYYTLKNIDKNKNGKAIFDDVIHRQGKTCSGYDGDNYNGTPVNLTCYIEVTTPGWQILDCSAVKNPCSALCDQATCGIGGNCTWDCPEPPPLSPALEYKEIDVSDPFPYKEQYKDKIGYAYNWYHDSDGQNALEKFKEMAKEDTTYAQKNLSYSFTLTPSDLNKIRAYNKSRLKAGGYTDFEFECLNTGSHNTADSVKTVKRCYSKFLNAISGKPGISYPGGRLEINAANVPIDTVRNKLKW